MKKIELEERKLLQLDILSSVHSFCNEQNIKYAIAYGTLLGAVRHGGYIPWDDDIDIVMLREDYDKFLKYFKSEIYQVASFETTSDWYLPFAKVYDLRTLIKDRKANTPSIGVNIDVFPIDDAPNSEEVFIRQRKIIRYLTTCNRIKLFKINQDSSLINNLMGLLSKATLCVFPKFFFIRKINILTKKYNGKGYSKAVYWASVGKTMFLDKSLYEDVSKISFENREFCAITDYDTYLHNTYGDYMQLPPEEKRISYHTSDAYWK